MLVTLGLAGAVTWLWRSTSSAPLKAAGMIIALLLATPYSLDYDLTVLAPAIAFWDKDDTGRAWGSSAGRANIRGGYIDTAGGSVAPCCIRAAAAPCRRENRHAPALAFSTGKVRSRRIAWGGGVRKICN
jgi:hypothetical protein